MIGVKKGDFFVICLIEIVATEWERERKKGVNLQIETKRKQEGESKNKEKMKKKRRHMPNIITVSYNELLLKHADKVNEEFICSFCSNFILSLSLTPATFWSLFFFFYFFFCVCTEWMNN